MTTLSRDAISAIVLESLRQVNLELRSAQLESPTDDTLLFGSGGALDSLALVSLVAEIEDRLRDRTDAAVTLVDEKAMSQRASPFRRVGTLISHVEARLAQAAPK